MQVESFKYGNRSLKYQDGEFQSFNQFSDLSQFTGPEPPERKGQVSLRKTLLQHQNFVL